MSNGAQCCALEICCPAAKPASRQKRAKLIADAAGVDEAVGHAVLDWMDAEGLTFAPASFRAVIEDIVTSTRKHAPNG